MEIAIQTLKRDNTTVTIERFCVDCDIRLPVGVPLTGNVQHDIEIARSIASVYIHMALASIEEVEDGDNETQSTS